MTTFAYFDEHGICARTVTGRPADVDEGGIEVPDGTLPRDVWWNGRKAVPTKAVDLALPATLPLGGKPMRVKVPSKTIALVNGAVAETPLVITPDATGSIHIELRGRCTAQHAIEVRSYAEQRAAAYPPLTELADAIVKGEPEALEAYIEKCRAVKARFPKR